LNRNAIAIADLACKPPARASCSGRTSAPFYRGHRTLAIGGNLIMAKDIKKLNELFHER
jgi:hypothetical protein